MYDLKNVKDFDKKIVGMKFKLIIISFSEQINSLTLMGCGFIFLLFVTFIFVI